MRISDKMYNVLRSTAREVNRSGEGSQLYVLGARKDGTITGAVRMPRTGERGCDFCPGVDRSIVGVCMDKIFKKKLVFAGFALCMPEDLAADTAYGWSYEMGNLDTQFPRTPILVTYPSGITQLLTAHLLRPR